MDLDPQAAEIATVNLIMKAMADQPRKKQRRPLILNQNVKVGNSLIGAGPSDDRYEKFAPDLAEIRRLRLEIAAETNGSTNNRLIEKIDKHSRKVNAALNEGLAKHFLDMAVHRTLNWAVEYPEIFLDEQGQHKGESAGFDVVVGNPPWEIIKPDLREYYAQFDPNVESKLNRKQVELRIEQLNSLDSSIETGWLTQKAKIEELATYYRKTTDFVWQGRGDRATHKLFMERGYGLLEREGRLSFVVPSGIYTDLGTKPLREMLLDKGRIDYLYNFSNERFFFPHVHHSFKFTLLGAQKGVQSNGFWATFRFNPRVAVSPSAMLDFVTERENLIYVRLDSLRRFSPDSLSVMEFQEQKDYEIVDKIYGSHPLLGASLSDRWNVDFAQDFHITNDRALFNQQQIGLPLYEGKMIHQFNAFFRDPRYWVEEQAGRRKMENARYLEWYSDYRIAFREIARSTDTRTCIATILPPKSFATITVWTAKAPENAHNLYLVSILNSLCFDYVVRFRVGTHMTLFLTKQLPVPRLRIGDPFFDAIVSRAAKLICTVAEYAILWEEVIGEPWDEIMGATDSAERQQLLDELDAIVANLYGLSREELDHILGTFPLVFPDSEEGWLKRNALLQLYDKFADSFGLQLHA